MFVFLSLDDFSKLLGVVLVMIFLFLKRRILLNVLFNDFFNWCLIIIIVDFVFLWILFNNFSVLCFVVGFKLVSGLFNIKIGVWWINILFNEMCCFWFLDKFCGWWFKCFIILIFLV